MDLEVDESAALVAAVGACATAAATIVSAVVKKEKSNILTLPARDIDAMLQDPSYNK
ncbi:hypothetical protein PF005_g15677 [Phytophthora fragariae]|nr:hypothetical protein PF003_g28505 [Phytophthora fragariae]KAE8933135.1 hypothetical protein PF009_g16855 [Phytophthora fragariae]KAE8998983.1 hypothetical protein PF011_g14818 [Phytophthora fragariae]KAE9098883.1 hypothetical protein PF010_g15390 [Phytophthora fragariae]KAE9100044.1 hypothetical protein PF007_g15666 [Phytophthora fragariae]